MNVRELEAIARAVAPVIDRAIERKLAGQVGVDPEMFGKAMGAIVREANEDLLVRIERLEGDIRLLTDLLANVEATR